MATVWLCGLWRSLTLRTCYLGTREDDRFLQVFQHERER